MSLRFEWDRLQADSNSQKHGVTFDEASTAFGDTLSLTIRDPLHSIGEERSVLIGPSFRGGLVLVVHDERADRTIRITSAREATRPERRVYEEQ